MRPHFSRSHVDVLTPDALLYHRFSSFLTFLFLVVDPAPLEYELEQGESQQNHK